MSKKHGLNEQFTVQEGKGVQLGQGGYVHKYALTPSALSTTGSDPGWHEGDHIIAITALTDDCILYDDLGGLNYQHGEIDVSTLYAEPIPKGTTIFGSWDGMVFASAGADRADFMVYKGAHQLPNEAGDGL
jgi:hypothetical protein